MKPVIWVVPGDLGGCGHMRMIRPALAAIAAGHDNVHLCLPDSPERETLTITEGGFTTGFRKVMAVNRPECDVLVIQRAMDHRQTQSIPMYQEQGIKVILEVDDDFDTISPRNIAYSGSNPVQSRWSNREWLKESTKLADLVIVTTKALERRYGGHGRVQIIPNFAPAAHLAVPRVKSWDGLRIGWMGQIGTHPDDLQVMKGALFEVLKRFDGRFYLVGGTSGVSRASGVPEALLDSVPYAPQDEYAKVTADMDIGIVPLDISAFNQAKSALKGLEYAALGLPFVASPTDPYLELPELGLYGGIARKPAHWRAQLSALAASQDLRDEVGGSNREIMRDWTIENQYWRWVEAWESVV